MGDELARGVFHVNYEIASFVGALLLSTSVSGKPTSAAEAFVGHAIRNGPVELRVLHARNLLEFLLSTEPKKTHYRADEYLSSWKPPEREELQQLKTRCCEHAFHLSKARITDEEHANDLGDKSWPITTFFPLIRATIAFVGSLLRYGDADACAPYRQALELACGVLEQILDQPELSPRLSPTGAMGPVNPPGAK